MKHLGQHFKSALIPLLLAAAIPGCSFGPSGQYASAPAPTPSAGYFIDPLTGASYSIAMPQPLSTRKLPTLKVAVTTRDNMLGFLPGKAISDAPQTLARAEPAALRAAQPVSESPTADEIAPLRLDHRFGSITRMVPFAVNRASLGPIGRKAVAELVPIVKEARHVYVRGRTDASGDPGFNESLAARRAATVAKAFISAGAHNAKITNSECIDCFVATNSTWDGRQMNRRVDVELRLPKTRIANLPPPVYALAAPPLRLARALTTLKE